MRLGSYRDFPGLRQISFNKLKEVWQLLLQLASSFFLQLPVKLSGSWFLIACLLYILLLTIRFKRWSLKKFKDLGKPVTQRDYFCSWCCSFFTQDTVILEYSLSWGCPWKHTHQLPESTWKSTMKRDKWRSPTLREIGNIFQVIIINIHFFLSDLQVLKILKHIFIRYSETIPAPYGKGPFWDIRLKSFKKPLGSNQLKNWNKG